jgi:SAM-dependent methyltransferase
VVNSSAPSDLVTVRSSGLGDPDDRSNGYDAVAGTFIGKRSSTVGVDAVRAWTRAFPPGAAILDLGCGHGRPITENLVQEGFSVYGVDASARLIEELRASLPSVQAECAAVEESSFFARSFDGVVAYGLMFLLTPEMQALVLRKVARALNPGGRFLFTAPWQVCAWTDALTGRPSVSLGRDAYVRLLTAEGLLLEGESTDEGGNHAYATVKAANLKAA